MNETECENLIKSVKWTDPTNLISLAILEFINISVISGNLLVIAAVFCSNKLRSVTNFFIVNLAVADLLVGLAVLPFSATWEVFKVWIFGDVWCRIWLAVDVWMCTASILNLCAISLDRYVAVTRPVTYPSIMSKKRAKSLIAGIWVLSFVICFPPLVGWKDQKHLAQPLTYTEGNQTLFFATTNVTRATTSAIEVTINETFSTIWPNQAVAKLFRRNKRNHHYNRFAMVTLKVKSSPVKRLGIQTNDYNIHDLKINNDAVFPIQNANDDYNDYTNDNNNHNNVISTPLTLHYEPTMSTSSSASRSASVSTSLPLSTSSNTKKSFSDETVFERILIKNKPNNFNSDITNINKNNLDDRTAINCPWKCELTNDRGYVLYSALGSFYIPMFVMLFFYWRIYRAAVRTTKAINQGFKTTKGLQHFGAHFDEQRLTLRIHRGRSSSKAFDSIHCNGSTQSTCTTLDTPSPERLSKLAGLRRSQYYGHDKIKISVSYPSNDNLAEMTCEKVTNQQQMERQQQQQQLHCKLSNCSSNMLFAVQYNLPGARDAHVKSQIYRHNLDVNEEQQCVQHRRTLSTTSRANNTKKMGKRNIKAQVKKFRMETKAAKTLAIIVGLFILCWLPFFTIYIIRPFCNNCIDPILFSVLFWLGYCNSAVNPMIYALFSKDFRFAFQRIICQCFCFEHHDKKILKKHVRRDSDMSTVRIRVRTPSLTTSAAAHSFCDESEYQQPTEISECDRVKR